MMNVFISLDRPAGFPVASVSVLCGNTRREISVHTGWVSGVSAFFVTQRILYMKYDKAIPFGGGSCFKRATGVL
jgi:hypothetical protein